MKKMMKYLFVMLFVFTALFLSSCKGGGGGNGGNPLDPYAAEKKLAEALQGELSSFKDPDSIVVVSVEKTAYDGKIIKLKLSGKNTYGGTVTTPYYLITESFDCDAELFEIMFSDKKNDPYDGDTDDDYDTWYDFYKSFYGPGGSFEWLYGMNFYEFNYYKGDLYQIHNDYDDYTKGEYMLNTISLYADPDYSPEYNVGKINEYLNKYKEEMGWR